MPFANTYTLVRHIEAAHIQLRTYECQFCNKTFKTQSQKADHTKKMHLTQHPTITTDLTTPFEFMNWNQMSIQIYEQLRLNNFIDLVRGLTYVNYQKDWENWCLGKHWMIKNGTGQEIG